MSRDTACYTLTFEPGDKHAIQLVENATPAHAGDMRYVRTVERKDGEEYSSVLYDGLSGARLSSTGYVSEKLKSRRLELHGPDEIIPWESSSRLGFEWNFVFEENRYKWKRAGAGSKELSCVMERGRDDPPVEVALYLPAGKHDRSRLQILHYNLQRFYGEDIKDLRGLETLFIMTAIALEDATNIQKAAKNGGWPPLLALGGPSAAPGAIPARRPGAPGGPTAAAAPPPPPPKDTAPPPSKQLIEALQEEEDGEVLVGVNTDIETHINRANRLLADESVLFIIIRSRRPEAAARATEVSLGVVRYRHRNMLPELHRYITEEEEEVKGPRVIKLDTPKAKPEWKPPPRLAIYMSRIELPDLAPKKTTAAAAPERPQSFVPPKAPTPTTSNSYSSSHLSSSSSSSRPPQSNTSGGGKPYQSPNLPPRVSSSAQTRPPTSSSHAPAPQPPQSQYSENHFSKLFKTRK